MFNALFALVEGTWPVAYRHWDDLVRHGIALDIGNDEILVWRHAEYPDYFRIPYIGKIDY